MMEAMHSLKISQLAQSTIDIPAWKQLCYDAMNDDFNTPILIAQLFEGVRINILKDGKETLNTEDLKSFEKAMTDFVF
jgi:cysteinyl-tRNA synthetase